MSQNVPINPKIYHIVHIDKLAAILERKALISDEEISRNPPIGTTIGMTAIKKRRLKEITLSSHPSLFVGQCVPFYFCSRSVMLYLFHMNNHPDIIYRGGQNPILHLEADLRKVVEWAESNQRKWAFTLTNAGSSYFEDRADLSLLAEINWNAVRARSWKNCREEKQAEFLMEQELPWELIDRIGVFSMSQQVKAQRILDNDSQTMLIEVKKEWYY
jgi:hypothetical protein